VCHNNAVRIVSETRENGEGEGKELTGIDRMNRIKAKLR
jgi:hypothetical protein